MTLMQSCYIAWQIYVEAMTTSTYIEDAKCRLNVVQKLNNIRIHVGMIKLEQENGRTVRLCSFL